MNTDKHSGGMTWALLEAKLQAKQTNTAWQQHTQLVRGNLVRVYEGMEFKRSNLK